MANAIPYTADRGRRAAAISAIDAAAKQNGDLFQTLGRGSAGDGSGAAYRYVSSGKSSITPDGGFLVSLGAGDDYLEMLNQDVANIRHFGAHPDETAANNTAAIEAALGASRNVFIPPGDFAWNGVAITNAETQFFGAGNSSILTLEDSDTAALDMQASFCNVHHLALMCDSGQTDTIGIKITDCSRSSFSNLRIGKDSSTGFDVGVSMHGATRNWINNFVCNQVQYNTIGYHAVGHSTLITGGEIQGGRHGIIQGLIDASYNPDLTDTTTGNLGTSVRIVNTTIEGLSYDSGISYGVFCKISQHMPTVENVYFEAIGTGSTSSKTNGVAIQAGYSTAGAYTVFAGKVSNCYFGDVPICIRIGRADGLDIGPNYATQQGSGYYFLDLSSHAAADSYVSLRSTRCDDDKYINDPSSRLQNSHISGSNVSGERGGSATISNALTFTAAPDITAENYKFSPESSDCKHRAVSWGQTFTTSYTGKHFYIRMAGAGVLSGQLNWTAIGQGSSYVGAVGRVDLLAVKENGDDAGSAARNGTLSTTASVTQPSAPTGASGLPTGTMSVTTSNAEDDSYSDIELNLSTAATGVSTVSQISGTLAYGGTGTCAIYDKDGTLLYTVK